MKQHLSLLLDETRCEVTFYQDTRKLDSLIITKAEESATSPTSFATANNQRPRPMNTLLSIRKAAFRPSVILVGLAVALLAALLKFPEKQTRQAMHIRSIPMCMNCNVITVGI